MITHAELPALLLANRVITESGCWEWSGSRREGYGRVRWNGRIQSVHRIAASLTIGLDLSNRWLFACHHCDNPPCFNPDHLFIGTPADNNVDRDNKGRTVPCWTYADAPSVYPKIKPCVICGVDYVPNPKHRGRSVVCSAECLSEHKRIDRRGRGHKLTADDIRSIRDGLAAGVAPKVLAEQFDISRPTITNIKLRKIWGHVT